MVRKSLIYVINVVHLLVSEGAILLEQKVKL